LLLLEALGAEGLLAQVQTLNMVQAAAEQVGIKLVLLQLIQEQPIQFLLAQVALGDQDLIAAQMEVILLLQLYLQQHRSAAGAGVMIRAQAVQLVAVAVPGVAADRLVVPQGPVQQDKEMMAALAGPVGVIMAEAEAVVQAL